jgi:alanine racemase
MVNALERAGAVVTINLDAVAENWRILRNRYTGRECAAVVKADGYGLGGLRIARALHKAGCRSFFVAHLEEGLRLRRALGQDAAIHVLSMPLSGGGGDCAANNLVPVLNSLEDAAVWREECRRVGRSIRCDLQLDTGMA